MQSSFANNNDDDSSLLRRTREHYDDDNDDDTLHVAKGRKHITPSQYRMLRHMAYLQTHGGMSWFCWRDFLTLNLAHGTIRNNLSRLKELGFIELSHKSNDAYYYLSKDALKNIMTLNRIPVELDDTVVNNNDRTKPELAQLIKHMTFDAPAVHNIHLKFHCPTIYSRLLSSSAAADKQTNKEEKTPIIILPKSKDLVLPREILVVDKKNGVIIKAGIIVHRTDYVSISLACSEHPIQFDVAGLVTITSSLCRLEERVRFRVSNLIDIPYSGSWIVEMWHIGIDSKERYNGPRFEETWSVISGAIYRIYSKVMKEKKKQVVLRLERQEYPNNPVHDAVEQKLSRVFRDGAEA